jgi:ABC-type bacteriocin/lantibiotic exporter with double-glycine peptidase domain
LAIGIVNGFAMAVDTRQSMRWLYEHGRPARGDIARTAALGWLAGVLVIAQAFCLSRIIHGVFIDARPRESLAGAFAGLAAAVLLRAALAWLRETSAFSAGEKVRTRVRRALFTSVRAAILRIAFLAPALLAISQTFERKTPRSTRPRRENLKSARL